MAVASIERKRLKREKARKAAAQKREQSLRRERIEDYRWSAGQAYLAGDLHAALYWAMKALRNGLNDNELLEMAIYCARTLREDATLMQLLTRKWNGDSPVPKDESMLLGNLALHARNYKLASEVFSDLLERKYSLGERLSSREASEIRQYLLYAESMEAKPVRKLNETQQSRSINQPDEFPVSQDNLAAIPGDSEAEPDKPQEAEEVPELTVEFEESPLLILDALRNKRRSHKRAFELALEAYKHSFRVSYDQLLCLPTLNGVESLWYQEEAARKVMKTFRGRAIMADEVGLGKTIEAGLVLKEYMMRGLVRSALVLVPSSLVGQWREELHDKFGLGFASSNDPDFRNDPAAFWEQPMVVASLHAARSARHFELVTSRTYDMVIVDEAHHLKNHTTKTWKLVNAIQKTFILLLTATPVQNNLEELFNLVTILTPGHLKTRTAFKQEFVARGNPTDPRNREKLRQLLKEVMIRNTRSITQLKLPARFAFTTRVTPSPVEEQFYSGVGSLVSRLARNKTAGATSMQLRRLLEAAGSSHHAAVGMLDKLAANMTGDAGTHAASLVEIGSQIGTGSKTLKVLELLKAIPDKKIVFVNYVATLEHLSMVFKREGIRHSVFKGGMTPEQKKASIDEFQDGCSVLLATGAGGEGHNLQFCNVMINFDLPWNPMQIEQRIGRIHRIGQTREVQVYNFCAAGSIEDHILEVLDRKINMFELVVGEVDMILGRLQGEQDFADMVFEIWSRCEDQAERSKAFGALAAQLKRARNAYEKSKELDEKLFREDFGV